MLLTLIIWTTILFVVYSWGGFFTSLYNKLCNATEYYNITETFLLGLCSILIPLQALSLFLPINQYTLLVFIFLSLFYWFFNKNKGLKILSHIKKVYKSLTLASKTIVFSSILLFLIGSLIYYKSYDAEFYHYQNIKWNESYAVVPGLGNLEDRFGFNSSYLLITALFSFSFVKGEVYTMVQILLFVLIWGEFLVKLFQSQYNIKYITVVSLLGVMYCTNFNWFACSSTDIIPILGVSYLLIKVALDPPSIINKPLFIIVVLISLLTYKLSIAFLCPLCIFPFIHICKEKNYRKILFIFGASFFIFALWCIRNIIITGYLIFPLYQIDLFSFDWKMPSAILQIEQEHIKAWAYYMFKRSVTEVYYPLYMRLNSVFLFLSLLMPFVLFAKRKSIDKQLLTIAIVTYVAMIVGIINAPDVRFVNGFVFGNLAIIAVVLLENTKIKLRKTGRYIAPMLVLWLAIISFYYFKTPLVPDKTLLLVPQGCGDVAKTENSLLEDLVINLVPNYSDCSYYSLPTSSTGGLPTKTNFKSNKMQGIETIEPRGTSLQDGLRTKEEYIDVLNDNVDKYIIDYYHFVYGITK